MVGKVIEVERLIESSLVLVFWGDFLFGVEIVFLFFCRFLWVRVVEVFGKLRGRRNLWMREWGREGFVGLGVGEEALLFDFV